VGICYSFTAFASCLAHWRRCRHKTQHTVGHNTCSARSMLRVVSFCRSLQPEVILLPQFIVAQWKKRSIVYLCWGETSQRVALWNDPLGDRHSSADVPETSVRQQSIRRRLNVDRPSTLIRCPPPPGIWRRREVIPSLVPVFQTIYNSTSSLMLV